MPTPELKSLMPKGVSYGQEQFVSQGAAIPAIASLLQGAADMDNAGFQRGVFGVDPSLQGNIGSVDELARLYGLGAVSDETRSSINRSNAYNALQGGYGAPLSDATGPANSMMDAANRVTVGQTALKEQEMAPQLATQAMQASLALNPTHVDVGSTLLSPAAILARQDAADVYNNELQNQARIVNAGSQQQNQTQGLNALFSGIGGLVKGVGGLSSLFGGKG